MTIQVEMTPLLRGLVASRYYVILQQMDILDTTIEADWESLSKFFEREEFPNTTDAVKFIWDLIDAIPLTDSGNIAIVRHKKERL